MKKIIIWIIVIIVVIGVIVFAVQHNSSGGYSSAPQAANNAPVGVPYNPPAGSNTATTTPIAAVATSKTSSGLTKYENDELGFSISYPSTWAVEEDPTGPIFTIPVLSAGQTSMKTLTASVTIAAAACGLPPIDPSTITGSSTLTVGGLTYKMISVSSSNSASGLNYVDQLYTLQQGTAANPLCYLFSFGSIASAATGSTLANNKALINSSEQAFTTLVKSFALVVGPAGQSETAHPQGK